MPYTKKHSRAKQILLALVETAINFQQAASYHFRCTSALLLSGQRLLTEARCLSE